MAEQGRRRCLLGALTLYRVGNSLRSDILPVLGLGGYGIHIPPLREAGLDHG